MMNSRAMRLVKLALIVVALWLIVLPAMASATNPVEAAVAPNQIDLALQATPTQTPTLVPVFAVVIAKPIANVRGGPGVNYPILGTLKTDARVQLIGTTKDQSWHVIDFGGKEGWISGYVETVRIEGDPKLLPVYAPPPTPTRTPTATRTPTPLNVILTVTGTFINVRTGPGTNYTAIGRLNRGETIQAVGANANFSWFVIIYRNQQAWVQNLQNVIKVAGNVRQLPVILPPPTPTIRPTSTSTPTPTPEPRPDIVMVSAAMNPPIPQPGQPFTLAVQLRNDGAVDAGAFAVATSFDPGQVFSAQNLPGLKAGQQTTVNLTGTVAGTGVFTIAIVIDLNEQLNESEAGKANNKPTFEYRIDRAFVATGSAQVAPNTNVDLGNGGTQDFTYSATNLTPINGAKFNILPGLQANQIHYDLLSPATINNTSPIPVGSLPPGTIVGFISAEGNRGYLRISNYNGQNMIFDYFVYVP